MALTEAIFVSILFKLHVHVHSSVHVRVLRFWHRVASRKRILKNIQQHLQYFHHCAFIEGALLEMHSCSSRMALGLEGGSFVEVKSCFARPQCVVPPRDRL